MKPVNLKDISELKEMASKPRRRNKYNAKSEYVDGIYFPSQHEARWYRRLMAMVAVGEVVRFHRQVIFDLPGGTKAVVDFQVIYPDGSIKYLDAKGKRTKSFIRNQKQVRALYGVDIEEV